jgi:hypothetical protein
MPYSYILCCFTTFVVFPVSPGKCRNSALKSAKMYHGKRFLTHSLIIIFSPHSALVSFEVGMFPNSTASVV